MNKVVFLTILLLSGCGININEGLIDDTILTSAVDNGNDSGEAESVPTPTVCEINENAVSYNEIGSGTKADPYLICTVEQFVDIGANTAAYTYTYKLMNDLDLSDYTEASDGTQYIPIGSSSSKFVGSFDGNYKTISNLTYTDGSSNYLGLFGYVENPMGYVKNLTLSNFNITGEDNIGAFAGIARYGKFWNIEVNGGTITGDQNVGGFAGAASNGTGYESIRTNITVGPTTGRYAGGVVGHIASGTFIINSYALGDVSSSSDYAGGFSGSCNYAYVTDSYALGDITANSAVGGFYGFSHHCRTENSFATGNVIGNDTNGYVGRFRGFTWTTNTANNYYNSNATLINNGSGGTNTAGTSGSYDLGATPNALFDRTNAPLSSWDFTNIWTENDSGTTYPTSLAQDFDEETWGSCSDHLSDSPFAGGIGTISSPYLLCTADQINAIDSNIIYYRGTAFKIAQDIDLTGETVRVTNGVESHIDGANFEISNHTLNMPGTDGVGMFSGASRSLFKNFNLTNVNITGQNSVGAILGTGSRSYILNSRVEGVVNGTNNVGGISGYNYSGGHARIFCNVDVTGNNLVGGVVGNQAGGSSVSSSVFVGNLVAGVGQTAEPLGGEGNGINSSYYDNTKTCTNCSATTGTGQATSYFYDSTNSPYSSWEFNLTWVDNITSFPTLSEPVLI